MNELSSHEIEFYSRQIVLPEIGYGGQLRLKRARVCIAGLGGLGSPAALSETVRIILGDKPRLAGKILHCDLERLSFEEIEISRNDKCPVCGSKPVGEPMPLKQKLITEVCGRGGRRVFIITPRKNLKLNISELYGYLKNIDFKIKVKADLGLTFETHSKIAASILESGIMVIEGAENEKEAYSLYNQIILRKLKIPKFLIEWEEYPF